VSQVNAVITLNMTTSLRLVRHGRNELATPLRAALMPMNSTDANVNDTAPTVTGFSDCTVCPAYTSVPATNTTNGISHARPRAVFDISTPSGTMWRRVCT